MHYARTMRLILYYDSLMSALEMLWLCFDTIAGHGLLFRGFGITLIGHTHTHTLIMTPVDEWSAQRTDLYLTTHKIHNRQTSMSPAGIKFAIPASQRPQNNCLDRATIGISQSSKRNVHYVWVDFAFDHVFVIYGHIACLMTIQCHCNTGYERHTETNSNAGKHIHVWIRNHAKV